MKKQMQDFNQQMMDLYQIDATEYAGHFKVAKLMQDVATEEEVQTSFVVTERLGLTPLLHQGEKIFVENVMDFKNDEKYQLFEPEDDKRKSLDELVQISTFKQLDAIFKKEPQFS